MQKGICLNCGKLLASGQKFCSRCGQKSGIHRFTFGELLQEFLHTIFHAERGLLRLLKGLALKPGQTAAAYVDGKRKTYFNPFTFLAVCIAFMVFLNGWIKPYGNLPVSDPAVLASMPGERMKELYIQSIERIGIMQNFGNKNLHLLSVLVSPYFALGLWLFFRKRKRNMAEITVAYILFTAFSNVLSTLLISPWLSAYRNTAAYYFILWGSIFLQTMYIAWGLKTFFGFRSAGGYIKVLAVLCLTGLIGFILLMAAMIIYVYQGEAVGVLQNL